MSGARPFVLCLTGSLGMGKSTAAKFFAEAGVPVHDSDAVVHALYENEAVAAIEAAFPGTTSGGKIDRNKLAAKVIDDKAALARTVLSLVCGGLYSSEPTAGATSDLP